MSGVVKKKKKTLISRIVGKVKLEANSCENERIVSRISFDEVHTSPEDIATIAARRNELRDSINSKGDARI